MGLLWGLPEIVLTFPGIMQISGMTMEGIVLHSWCNHLSIGPSLAKCAQSSSVLLLRVYECCVLMSRPSLRPEIRGWLLRIPPELFSGRPTELPELLVPTEGPSELAPNRLRVTEISFLVDPKFQLSPQRPEIPHRLSPASSILPKFSASS